MTGDKPPAAPSSPPRRARFLRWIPVVLLLLVVGMHQYNVRASFLSADRGGGFGMFAFVDATPYRGIHLHVHTADGLGTIYLLRDEAADLGLGDQAFERLRVMPSQLTLQRLATRVLESRWHEAEQRLVHPGSARDDLTADGASIRVVRIEVHGIRHTPGTDRLERTLLTSYEASAS